jgi:hypothetical protein
LHPVAKFKQHVLDPKLAEEMMKVVITSGLKDIVHCPCGSTPRKWNYIHHCSFPKHTAWVKMMPEPEEIGCWSVKTITEFERKWGPFDVMGDYPNMLVVPGTRSRGLERESDYKPWTDRC